MPELRTEHLSCTRSREAFVSGDSRDRVETASLRSNLSKTAGVARERSAVCSHRASGSRLANRVSFASQRSRNRVSKD